MIPHSHASILTSERAFAHVATVDPKGRPQLTVVWFEWASETFRFSTTKARAKTKNLSINPNIAATIVDPVDAYRFVELRGVASLEDDPTRAFINRMSLKYTGKSFPDRPGEERVIVSFKPRRVIVYPAG